MMVTNCPNCGAVLNDNHVCAYCGTVFRKEDTSGITRFIPIHKPCRVFKSEIFLDRGLISNSNSLEVSEFAIEHLAHNLAKAIAPMMKLDVNYDPYTDTQHIVGTIRVVEPDYRF